MSDGDPTRLCSCGCCDDGVETPSHPNPPGLPEIGYRLGGHPDFLHRMTARIHAWEVLTCADCDVRFAGPDRLARILEHIARAHPEAVDPADLVVAERPLAELGTRDADDPAIALMDAWAVVGDVLTFYQERFANESYLRTATERRSILELARAIGYELDSGVAAETYLAFTVDDAEGSPAQAHVPAGTQVLSIPSSSDEVPQTFETDEVLTARVEWNDLRPRMAHPLTLAADLSHVFLEGTATGLSAGRPVLLLLAGTPVVKRVARVHADTDAGHTKVDFSTGNAAPSATLPTRPDGVLDPDQDPLELTRAAVEAQIVHRTWAESDLQAFLTQHDWDPEAVLTYVADLRAATFRDPTRSLLAFRDTLGFFGHNAPFFDSLPDLDPDTGSGGGGGSVGSLTEAASIQAPPAEAAVQGGGGSSAVQVGGGSGGTGKAWPHDWDRPGGFSIWLDSLTDGYYRTSGEPYDVYLERPVEGLVGGSWAVIERPVDTFGIYEIAGVTEGSRTGFGMSTKVAGLRLEQGGADLGNHTSDKPADFNVRRSTAHVRSEALDLAPLPLTDDLTAGTTELRLGTMVLGLEAGRIVALRGEEVDADGAIREELLTLDSVAHASGYTTLHFEEGPLRSYVRSTVTLNANVALASHGETVTDEVLGSGDGAARHQRFTLKKPPLTHRSAVGGSESALTVRVGGVAWDQVDSLYGLDGTRRAYIVRIDDDAEATVTFGDAWSGAPLPTGQENVRATYRSGIGAEGEVGAGSLTLLKTRPFGIRAVTNPLAASGAEDPETLDDARDNAPLTVLTLDRIVSLRDYEDYARAFPGIGKARADSVWNGEGEVVHVTVADADGDPVVDPLYGRLLESMESARDPLRPVALETYQPFVFFVTAKVLI
ncbi:MAG TPA: baseplate J/gp47 family protein, partial [Longimicrobiales bacterium]|nr:baseplate J/gp47 family protein [Longimicrobiales bacterium]